MKLCNDVKNIKKNPKLLVPADKTNNLYKLTTEEYNKLLIENISRTYKKTATSAINSINTEAKAIHCKIRDRDCKQTLHRSDKQIY